MRCRPLQVGFMLAVLGLLLALPTSAHADLVAFEIEFGELWYHSYGDTWATQTVYPGCPPDAVVPPDDTLWLCLISNVVGPRVVPEQER